MELFTGVQYTYYDDDKLESEVFVLNNRKNGEYKSYWSNGELYEICNYIDGKKV